MKLGTVVVCGLIVLCAVTAVTLPEKKEQDPYEVVSHELMIYKNKLMYAEAVTKYKELMNLTPPEERYNTAIEMRDYCKSVGENTAFIEACRYAVELNPSDTESALEVLNSLDDNGKKEVYSYVHELMNTKGVSEEAYNCYSEYYEKIRGRHTLSKLSVADIGEWTVDSFALAAADEENDCVISTDGSVTVKGQYGRIDSYSPAQKYIAVLDNDQKVYVDTSSRRKLVPYDYENNTRIQYDYLGRLESGIANYRDKDGKWGYLNYSMGVIYGYTGFDYATPATNGLFAYKSEGSWKICYCGASGFIPVYSCKELYLDGDAFSKVCVTDKNAKTRTYIIYAKDSEEADWNAVKLVLDFSEKETTVTSERLGSLSFEDVTPFGEGCGAVKMNGSWCFIDKNGAKIENMGEYKQARSMSCGMCAAMNDSGLWGYIDGSGNFVIEPKFEEAHSLSSQGTAPVKEQGAWKFLRLIEYK